MQFITLVNLKTPYFLPYHAIFLTIRHNCLLQVPLQGFKALQGSTGAAGPRLFTLHQIDAPTINLPKAHTCFNRLDLPPYESKEKMSDKLTQAVEETCGFAVE